MKCYKIVEGRFTNRKEASYLIYINEVMLILSYDYKIFVYIPQKSPKYPNIKTSSAHLAVKCYKLLKRVMWRSNRPPPPTLAQCVAVKLNAQFNTCQYTPVLRKLDFNLIIIFKTKF